MRAITVSLVPLASYFHTKGLEDSLLFRLVNMLIYNLVAEEAPRPVADILEDLFLDSLLAQTVALECSVVLNDLQQQLMAALESQSQFDRIYVQRLTVVLEYKPE